MSDLPEVWKPVPGYEQFYEISNHGRLASFARGERRIRKLNSRTQYLSASLKSLDEKSQKTIYIHKTVAKLFLGPRPEDCVIRHLDGNRYNNQVSNLAYGTVKQNHEDLIKHGTHRHENNGRALLSERCVKAIKFLHSSGLVDAVALSKAFEVHEATIRAIIKGRNWKDV